MTLSTPPPATPPTPAGPDSASLAQDGLAPLVEGIVGEIVRQIESQRLPAATYRLQFHAGFTFRDAQALVPYLAALGITDLYASPLLQAREGSESGYDVVDCAALNHEIGTLADLESLVAALRDRQMGLILDVVPNHMGTASGRNLWWLDVLENGPSSPFAGYFDIDWMPLKPDLANKVLLPVLGEQFGQVLEGGELSVAWEGGALWVHYGTARFPLGPRTYAFVLTPGVEPLERELGGEHPDLLEYLSILTAIKNLPSRHETDPGRIAERQREKEVVKRRLRELTERSPVVAGAIEQTLRDLNGQPGNPGSFDRLDELLGEQAYRLAYWRVAADEINYRRFFDINELAAICVEHPRVFEATHALVFDLLDRGLANGLRIDHPDGLFDPRAYFEQLQERRWLQLGRQAWDAGRVPAGDLPPARPVAWSDLEAPLKAAFARHLAAAPAKLPLFVVVEKILGHNERLPEDWPVRGTVGYEFLGKLNGLFVDPGGEKPLSALYARFTGDSLDFRELAYQCKQLIARLSMASELSVLGHRLDRISERNRWTRDFTLNSLTRALQEVIANFSVYRTYLDERHIHPRDQQYVEAAIARAKRRSPAVSASIFDFVRDLLLLRRLEGASPDDRQAQLRFVGKFQQVTGPIMAKGVEDTAFYRYGRLASLNEVGGDPERFGNDAAAFHQLNRGRLPRESRGLSCTSTHDTKRGEDVRARINVLSEIPNLWREHVQRWARWNRPLHVDLDGQSVPSAGDEYLLYQTLVGIWPDEPSTGDDRQRLRKRVQRYLLKVAREAKLHTSWISPREDYEKALLHFADELLREETRRPFLAHFQEFASRVAEHGRWNSLAQLVLKIASPGVADFYQGTELWSLTLVDPDNRQPVDFGQRRQWLAALAENTDAGDLRANLLDQRRDGRIKLHVTQRGLGARRAFPELFTDGDYLPLETTGQHATRIVALARRHGSRLAIAVVPRWTVGVVGFGGPPPLGEVWGDTAVKIPAGLPAIPLVNAFAPAKIEGTESALHVAEVLAQFPVALFVPANSDG
ncbi:MAG: malto-oligosyltrehalose synthase [Pirellulaceae bacterium]|nr:malto-oligosyltrehalose synthase [Pirellulaceae bacterium]